ncbi:hypothetical protein NMY22_g12319 [Coprinellus aureogranulatus]|nr:hypothetical protein NMY22_g12319 [Coprinellus aureogranulatus]
MAKKKSTLSKKSAGAELPEGIAIRQYADKDWDEVCKLYWKGACVGNDSAMQIALRNLHLQPLSVAAYYLFATGVAAMYLKPSWLTAYVAPPSGLRKSIWESCKEAWRSDMKDIGKYYAFEKDDGGVSGFWVAEAVEKDGKRVIVGCVGLDSRSQKDKSVSEVRRLTVSPVEKYRRKGYWQGSNGPSHFVRARAEEEASAAEKARVHNDDLPASSMGNAQALRVEGSREDGEHVAGEEGV